jgi:YHYH protein
VQIRSAPCPLRFPSSARPPGLRTRALALVVAAAFAAPLARARPGQTDVLDEKALPLGDGRISTEAKQGQVFACATQFRAGGARHAGDWILGSTWDATRKIWVQGEVLWPDARFSIQTKANQRILTGNALPVGHATGTFPIARTDPAFAIDTNPNAIAAQTLTFSLPLQPTPAASPGCVPMGVIGVAVDGVPIFNALDAAGRDAVAHEVQDRCHGHPQGRGIHHYHGPSDCVPGSTENNELVGYALDGFGIYSGHDENGKEITNADLDECHGRASPVMWNGTRTAIYHYVMTREYPYTLGCYRGSAVSSRMQPMAGANGRPATERK